MKRHIELCADNECSETWICSTDLCNNEDAKSPDNSGPTVQVSLSVLCMLLSIALTN